MILKPHHFVGELTIGQAASEFAFTNELLWYVEKYEPIFFRALMGYEMYGQMLQGMTPEPDNTSDVVNDEPVIEPDGSEESTPDNESGGESETPEPEPNKWDKLVKVSLPYLTMFVWYKYQMDNNTQPTGSGEVVPMFDSAKKVSNQRKMVTVWNELVDHFIGLAQWIVDREEDYPDFNPEVELAVYHRLVVKDTDRENLYAI